MRTYLTETTSAHGSISEENPTERIPHLSLFDMGFICSCGVSLVGVFTLSLGSSGMWPLWKTHHSDRQEKLCRGLGKALKVAAETEPAVFLYSISLKFKIHKYRVFCSDGMNPFPTVYSHKKLGLLLTLFFSLCFDFLFSFDRPGLLWVLTGWLLLLESPFIRWLLPPIIPLHLSKPHLQSCFEKENRDILWK